MAIYFRSQAQLHRHINTVHLKKSFTCEICGASFGLLSGLRGHIDKVHNKDKWRKQCSVCQRWLSTPETLASHMRTHTGEKPYKCNFCDETFVSGTWMGIHRRKMHPQQWKEELEKRKKVKKAHER